MIMQWITSYIQTNALLLDFLKGFNTVPHQQLLSKLLSYGIQTQTHFWINLWLTLGKH